MTTSSSSPRKKTLGSAIDELIRLSGCKLAGVTLPQEVGGWIYLSRRELEKLEVPEKLRRKIVISSQRT